LIRSPTFYRPKAEFSGFLTCYPMLDHPGGRFRPLYRQSKIFDREGLDLDRSTLADWVGKSTALLEPLADVVGRHVLSAEAIFADETPV
jgi:transposase